MNRYILALTAVVICTVPAQAQTMQHHDHSAMQHAVDGTGPSSAKAVPREPGQSAFAAIQEIVSLLEADPQTDWSKVDIEALRSHLIDMDNVTLRSNVQTMPVDGGYRFTVTGEGNVTSSIRRMLSAHAATMNGVRGFSYEVAETPGGSILTVTASEPSDLQMLSGLGFIGVMTLGAHHQEHHLALASGHSPHH
ncbi:hypothetical protein V1T76_21880 [Roseibium sp. FZY0029]|uniref:hypothetical protein n=1 Tax=Roseibium sp. FZY0029 TaxID=3116647 RepID=UPI002E9D99DD|nr:hypothetical protein [Roseibium sp. FZY0029]